MSLPRMTLYPKIIVPALGNTTFRVNVSSPVYNLTLDSQLVNTTLVQNKSAIVHLLNCTANSTLDFLNFTMQSYLNVSHAHNLTELNVSASVNLTHPDVTVNVTMNTTGINVTDIWFTKFNHSLVVNVTAYDWVNATMNFTMSNNTVYANLTVPTLESSVALLAQRNASVLNVTLYHQQKVYIEDVQGLTCQEEPVRVVVDLVTSEVVHLVLDVILGVMLSRLVFPASVCPRITHLTSKGVVVCVCARASG
uniref:Uncharacterized protein n=1 Tax=Branchiostoma floridae TaxID=7739 RepID=C3YP51_BRAFL|eukprot:XP_002601930.1 hypothetical protein BRAFLDRAFT_86414 [Branchiostoma floridae]